MATKKKTAKVTEWPKVTVGNHSVRTEHEDGTVDFTIDWDLLHNDVVNALSTVEKPKKSARKKKQS